MKQYTNYEIKSIFEGFESCELSKKEWTHEAHLIIAVWYVNEYSIDKALNLLREKISRLNISNGVDNTDTSGYHETITKFWLITVKKFIMSNDVFSVAHACNLLVNSNDANPDYMLNFYDKDVLFSVNARRNWVSPYKNQSNIKNTFLRKFSIN